MNRKNGIVYLIGAGPGDPGLITVKGLDYIKKADVIIYDALVNPLIIAQSKPGAEIINAGKRGTKHTLEQKSISSLLVQFARKGKTVARIKGGDPCLFGRGGEEAEFLAKNGINFEMVPGISSAIASPEYAGIPVTHRDFTSMLTIVTGHEGDHKVNLRAPGHAVPVEWARISRKSTLVVLMGMERLPVITKTLLELGWNGSTPSAIVQWGTLPKQRVIEGTIENIAQLVEKEGVTAPAIAVFGKVVSLRRQLKWWEHKPLFGKTIVVTRAQQQAQGLCGLLESNGAYVVPAPSIEILPMTNTQALKNAIRNLRNYDWLVFTSANGARIFSDALQAFGINGNIKSRLNVCAIGPKTAKSLEQNGIPVKSMAKTYIAEYIIPELGKVEGKKILIPRALEAREDLPKDLTKLGAKVDVVPVYKTISAKKWPQETEEVIRSGKIDCVTFTSASTVRFFFDRFSANNRQQIFKRVALASIGPITTQALRERNLKPAIEAREATVESLAEEIIRHFAKKEK